MRRSVEENYINIFAFFANGDCEENLKRNKCIECFYWQFLQLVLCSVP